MRRGHVRGPGPRTVTLRPSWHCPGPTGAGPGMAQVASTVLPSCGLHIQGSPFGVHLPPPANGQALGPRGTTQE